ncbi:hypothetical protein [Pseudoclavibacter sp. VKM Ac-2888]|uniref:hypothetical protein n=1 Tax=Pseudoclavibacter sp. VKM Ac-2888 TaxID=2783830 RepID=UPI00188AEA5A|nr:hypothetical protein [Pseudoclavibacter sp. VKM Ac-2888]MBF4549485.1 hypothetical protein [Pseudoclavibacter sp. VKM Ac-2888]
MTTPTDHADSLRIAENITNQARRIHGLPRWYATLSTLVYLFGVAIVTVGVVVWWFVPFVGVVVLTLNAASFPLVLARWRAHGVVPKDGRRATVRYWLVTPFVLLSALALWGLALTVSPNPGIWVWAAIVIPFTFELINRLFVWMKR